MIAKYFILCGGILTGLMAIFHTQFYKRFNWKDDFTKLHLTNGKILYSIHVALTLLLFGFSIISIVYPEEIANSNGLGFGILIALSLFWFWRTLWQVVYFRIQANKRRNRLMHHILILVFFLLFVFYTIPLLYRLF